jgi:hypothetical protein
VPPTRRLPVLQNAPADEERPGRHWIAIGALFIFAIWAPLAMVSSWVSERLVHHFLGELPPTEFSLRLADASEGDRFWLWFALTATPVLAYALACGASGALVGRFGGKAGPREAAAGGALSSIAAAVLMLLHASADVSAASLVVLVPVGVGAAWLGGTIGKKRRGGVV